MSVSAVTSSLPYQTQVQTPQSNRSNFASLTSQQPNKSSNALNTLASLLSNTSSTIAAPTTAQSLLSSELGALGAQLQAGNLAGAKQAYATFAQDLSASSSQAPHHASGHGGHPRPVYGADANTLPNSNQPTDLSSAAQVGFSA